MGRDRRRKGELVITAGGIEGGVIYALSSQLRDAIRPATAKRCCTSTSRPIELLNGSLTTWPGRADRVQLVATPGTDHRTARCEDGTVARSAGSAATSTTSTRWSHRSRRLPIRLAACVRSPKPSAARVASSSTRSIERLMLKALPGTFCAGEMLDWEAPTGGYLLTGCFATGRRAGLGVLEWVENRRLISYIKQ